MLIWFHRVGVPLLALLLVACGTEAEVEPEAQASTPPASAESAASTDDEEAAVAAPAETVEQVEVPAPPEAPEAPEAEAQEPEAAVPEARRVRARRPRRAATPTVYTTPAGPAPRPQTGRELAEEMYRDHAWELAREGER